jgi:hypothetical protein
LADRYHSCRRDADTARRASPSAVLFRYLDCSGYQYSVNVGSRVYYFSFASFLHALENDAEPGLSQPVMVALGVLLVFVMNKRKKTSKKKSTPVRKPLPSALPDDYDDSIEERFHNNHTN